MKYIKYFGLLVIVSLLFACSDDDENLTPSTEDLFPPKTESKIDIELRKLFSPYNTLVEYRYIKNFLPSDWYHITPPKEEVVVPMGKFLVENWVKPLVAASSNEFVKRNFPKKIIFVGSPAYKLNGSRILGQAEGGTLIRYTEVNDYNTENKAWVKMQLHTAYHEYAHTLHQTFKMPNQYREVTPDSYVKNAWQTITDKNKAIESGMVTPYGMSAIQEDFAELFSGYIVYNDTELQFLLKDEVINLDKKKGAVTPTSAFPGINKRNKGRVFIRTKLEIMKNFLNSVGFSLDKCRKEAQDQLKKLEA